MDWTAFLYKSLYNTLSVTITYNYGLVDWTPVRYKSLYVIDYRLRKMNIHTLTD